MTAAFPARVRIVELPSLAHKGDVSDWVAAGGTREELDGLVARARDILKKRAESLWNERQETEQQETSRPGPGAASGG